MAVTTVDARNLQCPMPVVRIATPINEVQSGQTVELITTDRDALSDIPASANRSKSNSKKTPSSTSSSKRPSRD